MELRENWPKTHFEFDAKIQAQLITFLLANFSEENWQNTLPFEVLHKIVGFW